MSGLVELPNEVARTGYIVRKHIARNSCVSCDHEFSIDVRSPIWNALRMATDAWRLSPPVPGGGSSSKAGSSVGRGAIRTDATAVIAYTDGACSGNPGPGGWAWAVSGGQFATGAEEHSTNQRMEVTAAYQAVLAHTGPIEVVSDSTYVVNCFKQRWWEGWLKRGWTNSQRKPVANRDLWEPFIELVRSRGNVTFRWVKGHSEDRMNQFVDQLAVEASQTQTPRSGRCP